MLMQISLSMGAFIFMSEIPRSRMEGHVYFLSRQVLQNTFQKALTLDIPIIDACESSPPSWPAAGVLALCNAVPVKGHAATLICICEHETSKLEHSSLSVNGLPTPSVHCSSGFSKMNIIYSWIFTFYFLYFSL